MCLSGLSRGGFFQKAAFYGGTCLRIFHGLNRFSEDLDFSLIDKKSSLSLEDYFEDIVREFQGLGREVEISKRTKRNFTNVESAFLKDNTDVINLKFQTEPSIKIKLEVDTTPPGLFSTEHKLLMLPYSFMVRCYTLPDLFAGKMHALLFRKWNNRIKGRDWYDFEWYLRNNIPLNFAHFTERAVQSEGFSKDFITRETFREFLKEKINTTNIKEVKQDVLRFVKIPKELDIWSKDYFLQLAERVSIVD
ncbi:hypothetical protein JCM15548_13029 [Geofilum rubicundum JCM 15548]|uniref:Nucleotidyl transferase AbiEii/AbiGii toxin family protein n=1 Tax=Geofilum rubicundum JCM 15548 TaxID=1236989 RepID=A0A0E9LZI9_9BACT|nr:hypothetical protein JCM15548_13029 [Geofilum rubicundum JCM 15548]